MLNKQSPYPFLFKSVISQTSQPYLRTIITSLLFIKKKFICSAQRPTRKSSRCTRAAVNYQLIYRFLTWHVQPWIFNDLAARGVNERLLIFLLSQGVKNHDIRAFYFPEPFYPFYSYLSWCVLQWHSYCLKRFLTRNYYRVLLFCV